LKSFTAKDAKAAKEKLAANQHESKTGISLHGFTYFRLNLYLPLRP